MAPSIEVRCLANFLSEWLNSVGNLPVGMVRLEFIIEFLGIRIEFKTDFLGIIIPFRSPQSSAAT